LAVRVVATGEESERKLREQGVEPGKIQSSVTTRKGRTSTKKTFSSSDGSVTRIDEVTKEPGKTTTKVSSRDLQAEADRDVIAEKIVSDLNESARKSALKESEEVNRSFAMLESNRLFNLTQASVIASAERKVKEEHGLLSKEDLDVEENVRFSQLSGKPLDVDYLRSSERGREILVEGSEVLNRILVTDANKERFIRSDDNIASSGSLKSGFKDVVVGVKSELKEGDLLGAVSYPFVKSAVAGVNFGLATGKNVNLIKQERVDSGYIDKSERPFVTRSEAGKVVLDFSKLRRNSPLIFTPSEKKDFDASLRGITSVVGSSVKSAVNYLLEESKVVAVENPFKESFSVVRDVNGDVKGEDFNKPPKFFTIEFGRDPTPEETSGLAMIGYTGASVFTNKIPVVGQVGTEAVDIGLATPDYLRGFVNPTPSNLAGVVAELIDVGVDLIPFAPNVNVNTNYNALIDVDNVVDVDVKPKGGASRPRAVSGELRVSSNGEIGFGQVSESEVGFSSLYDAVTRIQGAGDLAFTTSKNVVSDLRKGNLNRSEVGFDYPVSSEVGFDVNNDFDNQLDNNFDFNNNFNNDFDNQFDTDFNNQLNNNYNNDFDFNYNANFNFNNNVNTNFNFNFARLSRGRKPSEVAGGGFSPFAKVRGRFSLVASPVASKEDAFRIGADFVQGSASRTFGVSESAVNLKGVNVSESGSFKRKKGRKGFLFVEPSSFAINTPGELREITAKGIKSRKNKRLIL